MEASNYIDSSIDVVNRLRKINSVIYVKTEKLNFVDSYVLKSEISEEDSLILLDNIFRGAIEGSSGEFNIINGETLWWIGKEDKKLSLDIITVNAEIDGYPIQVIISTSYFDYNVPLNITVPEEAKLIKP